VNDANSQYDVVVVGLGYIGLPTAAVIARSGSRVLGVDVNAHAVETISRGQIHIEEADLEELVADVVARGLLVPSLTPAPADIFVLAVPTPLRDGNVPDVSYVMAAVRSIAPVLKRGDTVIIESTSPVGTTEQARDLLETLRPDLSFPHDGGEAADVALCYCPERVLPGRILIELEGNDRSIGGITPACAEKAADFYRRFVRGTCSVTSARTAEMVKLVENSFRDVNIAFANEISMVCDSVGLDVWEVIALANRHPRVDVLQPGPGVGGHCIAVDPWFIVHSDPERTPLIRTARTVNDGKVDYVVDRAARTLGERQDIRVACLGLAFKANIDDLRESPAVKVAELLAKRFGDRVDIVEPHTQALPKAIEGSGAQLVDLDTALGRCDLLLLLVDHREFHALSPARRAGKIVQDTRGIWRD
jgi:UDP-N-acetyl-D-mannosaminuronic acid dehydrogenase